MSETTTRAHLTPYEAATWTIEIRTATWSDDGELCWETDFDDDPVASIPTEVSSSQPAGDVFRAAFDALLAAGWRAQPSDEGNDGWSPDATGDPVLFVEPVR
ncbi:hypothetical protein [Streptomyces sp. NPDC004250]|uniref:hypothetical protein n=1 Tax=Streptomyces sp. NPDC004250 TaxID=3364692 RepID=UPI0036899C9C